MTKTSSSLRAFLNDEDGAAAVEYCIIAVAMAGALIPGFYYVTSATQTKLEFIVSFFG